MFATITMDLYDGSTKDVEILANAATPFRYKMIFHEDLLTKFANAEREENGIKKYDIDFMPQLTFIMAKQAEAKKNPKIKLETLNELEFINWLEEFDSMAIENNSEQIMDVYMGNVQTSSDAKKNIDEQSEK